MIASGFAHVDGAHALDHNALASASAVSAEGLDPADSANPPCDDHVQHSSDETCSTNVACSLAIPLAEADAIALAGSIEPSLTSLTIYSGLQIGQVAPPPKLTVQI